MQSQSAKNAKLHFENMSFKKCSYSAVYKLKTTHKKTPDLHQGLIIFMDVPHKMDTNETKVALENATTPLNREIVEPPSYSRNLKRQFVPFFAFYYTIV